MTSAESGHVVATHVVPSSGLSAWTEPDPKQSSVAQLDPGLEVRVIDRRGEWAQIRCSNGWEAWVDAQSLVRVGATDAPAVAQPTPADASVPRSALSVDDLGIPALLGAAMVIIGSVLPWWTVGSTTITAWHIPVKFLATGSAGGGVDVGPFLLVTVLVALPLVTRRPLPMWLVPAIAAVPLLAAVTALVRGLHGSPSLHPGIGLLLTLAGGLLIMFQNQAVVAFGLRRSKK